MLLLVLAGCGDDIAISKPVGAAGGAGGTIYLFDAGVASAGMIAAGGGSGTRAAVDTFVANGAIPAVCAGKTVRAFISRGGGDDIVNMPFNYGVPLGAPVYGALGPKLANNWGDLLDGNIPVTLQAATGLSNFFWSGSDGTGAAATHCTNWSTTSNNGWNGRHDVTGNTWLGLGASLCSNTLPVLGICY